jgi:hypothetical protein
MADPASDSVTHSFGSFQASTPTREENERRVCDLLDDVARGENVATAMFEAVVTIQRGRQDRVSAGPIDLEQRGRLLTASVRAQAASATHLPTDYDRASLNTGMWAIAYQITMWAESLDKTLLRNPDDVLDFDEGARIFQNELENIILRENKAGRVRKRLTLNPPSQTPAHSI